MGRFYDPTEGMLTLDGNPLRSLNVTWLRRQVIDPPPPSSLLRPISGCSTSRGSGGY